MLAKLDKYFARLLTSSNFVIYVALLCQSLYLCTVVGNLPTFEHASFNPIITFVAIQIEFNRQSERAWLDLVPTLEQIAVASPSAPFNPAVAAPSAPTYSPGGFSGFGGKAGGGSQDAPPPAPAPADNPFDDRDEDELVGV